MGLPARLPSPAAPLPPTRAHLAAAGVGGAGEGEGSSEGDAASEASSEGTLVGDVSALPQGGGRDASAETPLSHVANLEEVAADEVAAD
eukprot:4886523-Prymnesium_polylepis.1